MEFSKLPASHYIGKSATRAGLRRALIKALGHEITVGFFCPVTGLPMSCRLFGQYQYFDMVPLDKGPADAIKLAWLLDDFSAEARYRQAYPLHERGWEIRSCLISGKIGIIANAIHVPHRGR